MKRPGGRAPLARAMAPRATLRRADTGASRAGGRWRNPASPGPMARILAALFLLLSAPLGAGAFQPLEVFVSILPQRFLVERVAGDRARVSVLVGPGQSPHTFEPSARQMVALEQAAVMFRVGMPFEATWLPRIRAANPRLEVVDQREGLALRGDPAGHDHSESDSRYAGRDPHIWTSPRLMRQMASQVSDTLARLDPPGAAGYQQRLEVLLADLDDLDRAIRQTLAGLGGRRFLVFHPTWGYFADDYGLVQVAIEQQGKEPGPRGLARLIDEARAEGVRVVFAQRQLSTATAEAVARAIGARVIELDPLAEDCLDNLRRVAGAIREALE